MTERSTRGEYRSEFRNKRFVKIKNKHHAFSCGEVQQHHNRHDYYTEINNNVLLRN